MGIVAGVLPVFAAILAGTILLFLRRTRTKERLEMKRHLQKLAAAGSG